MSTKFSAQALAWWLESQGKLVGATVCTQQLCDKDPVTGKDIPVPDEFEISVWKVDGIKKPTDAEVDQIIEDYETSLAEAETKQVTDRAAVLVKLGITEAELKILLHE